MRRRRPGTGHAPRRERRPHRNPRRRALDVVGVERPVAGLGAAAHVPADRAAIVPQDRPCRTVGALGGPHELVGDEHPSAGRTASREQVAHRHLEARLTAGRGRHALERGIEMAHVRWAEHDLREHPRQGARLDRDRTPLAVDRGAGDPAAAAGEIGDDVTRARVGIDARSEQGRRRGRRQALEDRQRQVRAGRVGAKPSSADASPRASSRRRSRGPRRDAAREAQASSSSSGSSSNASSVVDSGGSTRSRSSISSSSSSSSRSSSRSISSRTSVPLV